MFIQKKYHNHLLVVGLLSMAASSLLFLNKSKVFGNNQSQFNQQISSGVLNVDIVDGSGNSVANPNVDFSAVNFSFSSQQTSAVLGIASQKIRILNPTATSSWTVSIAATTGNTALWNSGFNTYDFNGDAATGRLQVDASSATITPEASCAITDISKGVAMYFDQGVKDTIDILTAGNSADTGCYWDVTTVNLTQDIPASQPAGTYSLDMTLTIS